MPSCTFLTPAIVTCDVIAFICVFSQDKDEQTQLEMKHRKEEDDLYRKFARQREEEDKRMREEFRVSAIL
jgi:hypothetical protein